MLAYYYQLKTKPEKSAEAGFLRLTKNQKGTMKKQVLLFYLLLLLTVFGVNSATAQSVSINVSSTDICLGDQLSLDAIVTGGPATQCKFDFNNDGTYETTIPTSNSTYTTGYLYTAAGNYTIKVEVLVNGNPVVTTQNVTVYDLPIPAAIVNGTAIQCFRGNLVTLTNTSVITSNAINRITTDWGDGRIENHPLPTTGQVFGHTYNAPGSYTIGVRVIDSKGCFKDTFYNSLITIKNNITPSFDVIGTRNCDTSQYLFVNTTFQVAFNLVSRYTWDFGDGTTVTRQKPWTLPKDSLNYDTIYHNFIKNGVFLPALIIEDTTGCIDSFRIDKNSNKNKPENIVIVFDAAPYLTMQDTIKRDSVCYGTEGNKTLVFKQTPNEMINPGNGELVWTFDDPPSQQQNVNTSLWRVPHNFQRGLGLYNVRLRLWPNQPQIRCRKDTILPIEVLGPRARIEDPQNNIVISPTDKNQCQALASGYYGTVDFVNTSQYYKSDHVFRLWDFGDDFAPQCTSYLVPNVGFPPLGGWATAADQYNFSTGYWRQNGQIYPGRRLDCRYSADTLPLHNYPDWNVVYKWYRYGHDFMPWNPNQYTRTPADTLPNANPKKTWVPDWDTLFWNKPVYLDPNNGTWSLTQGTWTDPFTNQIVPWPRIDNVPSRDQNGLPVPSDLRAYNRFTLNNGAPDPLAGFWGSTKGNQLGYGFIPRGTLIDPLNDTMTLEYLGPGEVFFQHHYDSTFEESTNTYITFYRYMFNRGVQRCHTVRLFLKDSMNNVGNKSYIIPDDITVLDSLDCKDDDQVQLKLMRPDARGVGKSGVECPGAFSGPDNAGIRFNFGPVSDRLGDYPGIQPDCGQSWIRFCHDSMADRLDQTPCALDGFVDFGGGTTPGGLTLPPFANQPDFGQFLPPNLWSAPSGTSFWYQYGPGVASGWPLSPPANPTGDITIGILIGTGDPANPCLSDTIWYHNFLNITDLDGRFYVDPTYHPITKAPTNGVCKLYCKNDMVNFVYIDSTQRNVKFSMIAWGDNSVTVDSFYYSSKLGVTDGYYVNGFRRVRYQIYFGPCGDDAIGRVYDSIVWPNGQPGVDVDTLYTDNYTFRIYDPTNNPYGSLNRIGPNTAGDSVQWQECGRFFWVANTDTLKTFYLRDLRDKAYMLLPVQHKFWSSSFEDDCKRPGSSPRAVAHTLVSTKECKKFEVDNKLLVRGVIDSVRTRNEKGEWDEIFCKNEPVYFYDSIRYYRPDCSLSDPIFNPNFHPVTGVPYGAPFNSYHYDTIDYWRPGSVDINEFRPDGSFIEKVKYYFGDGDSAMWTNPVHKYKQAGKYNVMMLSRDKKGCWDTTTCTVYVSEPNAIPVIKPGLYNCGDKVTFFDRSTMTPIPGIGSNPYDSIRFEPQTGSGDIMNRNFWFFGERKTDTLRFDASAIDTPQWNYRGNGQFRIKLVVETAQGCKDTGFVNLFISGPRPKIKVITDTVGCAPFKVKVVNLADVEGGQGPNDKPTKRTDILWGDANSQTSISLNQYDTVTFIYPDSGTFFIFARGDDNNPLSDNSGCKIVNYPDTTGGIDVPIKISVKKAYKADVNIDKSVVCVDQPFTITNLSDTISYTQFKYSIFTTDFGTEIFTVTKPNTDNRFTQTYPDTGSFKLLLIPTAYAPGLPQCPLYDTADIKIVRPYASFTIDSVPNSPKFHFNNTSMSSSEYTWTASKNGTIVGGPVDMVQASRDWNYDFGKDTGDVVICLEAFTPDPIKPTCVDKVCDTISYRFIVEFEIYNVFTPGKNDDLNNKFDIKIKGQTKYELFIYNRWGTKVFESTDADYDWDGTNFNNGSDCPAGTYYYVFKYEMLNGDKKSMNGTITLIRE